MILAMTRPSRSADLVILDLQYCRHTPEGVVFQEAVLANSPDRESQEQGFSFQLILATADSGSEEQTRLFLAMVRPQKPVCSSG